MTTSCSDNHAASVCLSLSSRLSLSIFLPVSLCLSSHVSFSLPVFLCRSLIHSVLSALFIARTCRLTLLSTLLPAARMSTSTPDDVSAYSPPVAAPPAPAAPDPGPPAALPAATGGAGLTATKVLVRSSLSAAGRAVRVAPLPWTSPRCARLPDGRVMLHTCWHVVDDGSINSGQLYTILNTL